LPITTIIFDLDDTLQAQDGVEDSIILELAQQVGQQRRISPEKFLQTVQYHALRLWSEGPAFDYCLAISISAGECLWGDFTGDQPELRTLADWVPTYRAQVWQRALARMGIGDAALAAQLSAQFIATRRARHLVYPEVVGMLRDLHARYTLALLTNGAPDLQREKFNASGLAPFFTLAVVSGEEGIGKPDPRIFQLVLTGWMPSLPRPSWWAIAFIEMYMARKAPDSKVSGSIAPMPCAPRPTTSTSRPMPPSPS
jgi:putative hydrolase of the HAD superfamily